MLDVTIPGFGRLQAEHLVLDYNGTLACDGKLLPGVRARLNRLAADLSIHVITADTFGKARAQLRGVNVELSILPPDHMHRRKLAYVKRLGAARCVCIGNGRNDRLMVKAAAVGMVVIQEEGAASESVAAADIVCTNIVNALDLLKETRRLIATLRS